MSDDEDRIAAKVGRLLRAADETIACAESITGGRVCARLTDVPGASAYVDRGFVTYAYEAKTQLLGIDRSLIDRQGAVCGPVGRAMAEAARDRAGTTWGIGLTGIAGPSGGSPEKPIGTTYIGIAYAAPWGSDRSTSSVNHYTFDGDRDEIRTAAATQALVELETELESRQ